jgi:hypothetical protein
VLVHHREEQEQADGLGVHQADEHRRELNAEDPHPVARKDAAEIPEFKSDPYLVASTQALEKAKFTAPDPNYPKVQQAIQKATARVANGDVAPDAGSQMYTDDLKQAIGADKVTSQA